MLKPIPLSVLTLCLLLSYTGISQKIPWTSDYLLVWSDFQGAPDAASSFAALTHYDIGYHYSSGGDGKMVVTVDCSFDKLKSWKKPERELTPKLLLHEEIHFYIAEVYARKMRQAFEEYTSSHTRTSTSSGEISEIFHRLMAATKAYNEQYDQETDHSKNEEKQKEWTQKVVAQLKELSKYEVK